MSEQLKAIVEKYIAWKGDHDEGYIYDEIFEFVNGELSRGDLHGLFESLYFLSVMDKIRDAIGDVEGES